MTVKNLICPSSSSTSPAVLFSRRATQIFTHPSVNCSHLLHTNERDIVSCYSSIKQPTFVRTSFASHWSFERSGIVAYIPMYILICVVRSTVIVCTFYYSNFVIDLIGLSVVHRTKHQSTGVVIGQLKWTVYSVNIIWSSAFCICFFFQTLINIGGNVLPEGEMS